MSVVINCKECANKCCKNNSCEYDACFCPDFMPKKKEDADMVEVIRCKDCKHWDKHRLCGEWPDKIKCYCEIVIHNTKELSTSFTSPDDYCSFAEKTEEG